MFDIMFRKVSRTYEVPKEVVDQKYLDFTENTNAVLKLNSSAYLLQIILPFPAPKFPIYLKIFSFLTEKPSIHSSEDLEKGEILRNHASLPVRCRGALPWNK